MSKRIYVVGGDVGYANWVLGDDGEIVDKMEKANIVMFSGGSDVDPSLYNRKPHPTTGSNPRRDRAEIAEFNKARELNLPILSICRGSQFSCVMAGGLLVQHQSHPYRHNIKTSDGKILVTNSTHHQRQYPFNLPADEYELLAWAINDDGGEKLSPFSLGEDDTEHMNGLETEICFYKKINTVAIQGHPELLHPASTDWDRTFIHYCRELVTKYLKV